MSILREMVSPATEEGVSSDSGPTDFEALRKKIFGGGNKLSKRGKKSDDGPSEAETIGKEIEKLFAGENFEEIAALYFNARFAMSGWDGFLLDPDQKKVLGLSLATSMRLLVKIDPGYLALLIFTTNFGGIIAQKEMIFSKLKKEMDKANAGKPS
jgi:hypothetical protein